MINFKLCDAWFSGGVEFNFPRGQTWLYHETLPAVLCHYPNGPCAAIASSVDLARRVGW
jgi:hypothetical protein